jgi:cell division protein FtsB
MIKKLLISILIFSAAVGPVLATESEQEQKAQQDAQAIVNELAKTKAEAEKAGLSAEQVREVVLAELVTKVQALKKRSAVSREFMAFLIGAGLVAVVGVGGMYLLKVVPLQETNATLIKNNLELSTAKRVLEAVIKDLNPEKPAGKIVAPESVVDVAQPVPVQEPIQVTPTPQEPKLAGKWFARWRK